MKVAEELVEPVDCRQTHVQIAEVVFCPARVKCEL
jgi:hypothetical protein